MSTSAAEDERRRHFCALFDAHHTRVLVYARRRLPVAAAEDAVADTFLAAWRHLDSQRGDELLWLYGIARRCVFNQRRSLGRATRLAGRLLLQAGPLSPDPADEVCWGAPLRAALRQLTETEREVLRLVAWEHLSTAEGAIVLGCSATAFRIRLHRARRRLQALLDADDAASSSRTARSTGAISSTSDLGLGQPTTAEALELLSKENP